MELGASKDELPGVRAKASKEKKALEKAFNEGFEVIFNYCYGYCAFAHNIFGSEPMIPNGMLDTSKPLPHDFFINPRCPPSTAPTDHSIGPNVDVREEGKSPPADEVGLGTQSNSLVIITGEVEEPDPPGGR